MALYSCLSVTLDEFANFGFIVSDRSSPVRLQGALLITLSRNFKVQLGDLGLQFLLVFGHEGDLLQHLGVL